MQNFTTEIKKITCTFNLHAAGYQPDRPNHHLRLRFCSLQILPKDLCWLICRQRQFSINSPHKRSKRFIPAASLNLANVFLPQVSGGRNTCMRPFCIAPVPALVERCNSPVASHNLHTLQIVRTTIVLYLTRVPLTIRKLPRPTSSSSPSTFLLPEISPIWTRSAQYFPPRPTEYQYFSSKSWLTDYHDSLNEVSLKPGPSTHVSCLRPQITYLKRANKYYGLGQGLVC